MTPEELGNIANELKQLGRAKPIGQPERAGQDLSDGQI